MIDDFLQYLVHRRLVVNENERKLAGGIFVVGFYEEFVIKGIAYVNSSSGTDQRG